MTLLKGEASKAHTAYPLEAFCIGSNRNQRLSIEHIVGLLGGTTVASAETTHIEGSSEVFQRPSLLLEGDVLEEEERSTFKTNVIREATKLSRVEASNVLSTTPVEPIGAIEGVLTQTKDTLGQTDLLSKTLSTKL